MEETAAEVCLARRSVSIKWLHISGSHETQTTFACSQEKVPREGEVF